MKQDERDVVPVLWFPPRPRCGRLGEQKAGEAGHVDLGGLFDTADSRLECADFDVTRREAGTPQVCRAEVIATVEGNAGAGWCVVEIGEQLELHDGLGIQAVCLPSPYSFMVGFELCISKRVLEPYGVDRTTRDF